MPNITNLIQTYYRLKMSQKLNAVIHQVDDIAVFAIEVLDADFVALFYRKPGGEDIVPVAYSTAEGTKTRNLFLLEHGVRGFVRSIRPGKTHQRWYQEGESANTPIELDQFARENNFQTAYRFPCLADDQVRTVVAIYWSKAPTELPDEFDSLLELVSTMLISSMAVADDMAAVDSFSLKLCELLSVLEIPIGEYRFRDLVTRVVERSRMSVDNNGVCLIMQDEDHEELTIGDFFDNEAVSPVFLDEVRSTLSEKVSESSGLLIGDDGGLYDLTDFVQSDYTTILAADMQLDETHRYILVTWSRLEGGLNDNDRHLFSAFCLFMQTVLKNALLVRRLRRTNRLLKKSANQMANLETVAAMADMTSGLAHEFNNIIGGIVGRVQLMKMKLKDEAITTDLQKVESLALEGAKTVKRIQEFSLGAKYKNLEPVDLCQIVEICFQPERSVWQKIAASKRVSVKRLSEEPEEFVDGSQEDLVTAFNKLIENAVEHAPNGSDVIVKIEGDDTGVTVLVSDQGQGIPDAIKKKVFYPFFSTKNSPRAGLSLATVHGIVVRHGGKIDFESSPDRGTTFRMFLKRPNAYDEISEITNRNKAVRELAILVVDDDEQIREILADMLAMDGHETVTCSDGPSALQTLDHRSFDLMITDLGMPGMSGLELSGAVHKQFPELPIAMITGWGTQLNHDEIAHRGIKVVISKPFHLKDVKSLISDLIER